MVKVRSIGVCAAATWALCSGCSKKEDASTTVSSAAPVASTAQAPAASNAAASENDGHVVSGKSLVMFDPPRPKGAPADGTWSQVLPITEGNMWLYYQKSDDGWMKFRVIDCNSTKAKEMIAKPEMGDFAYCAPTAKSVGQLKGFPMFAQGDEKSVKLKGHLVVIAGAFMDKKTGKPKYTLKEVEEFLASVDLDALAKL